MEQISQLNGFSEQLSKEQGIEVYSVDEKCGMQALERASPDLPIGPSHIRRRECNYIRHGTQSLIAALHVCSGKVWASIDQTRTEDDFSDFVEWIADELPADKKAVFILDQLNTHKSEDLVRLMAKINGDLQDLGIKGKSGILRSMNSRMKYLQGSKLDDYKHQTQRIRFVYTPKHCSWLNVIEGWFSGLQSRLLALLSCKSTDDLADQVLKYVDYYNEHWAKKINWVKAKKEDIELLIDKTKRLVTKLSG